MCTKRTRTLQRTRESRQKKANEEILERILLNSTPPETDYHPEIINKRIENATDVRERAGYSKIKCGRKIAIEENQRHKRIKLFEKESAKKDMKYKKGKHKYKKYISASQVKIKNINTSKARSQ